MRKEYFSTSGLWIIITALVIYAPTIYFMFDSTVNSFITYLPFVIILILNSLMLFFYGRELFSKEPLLILEEDKLTYRGMFKTHVISYEDITTIQRTFNGSRKRKQINRIGIKVKDIEKPVYIIVQSIEYNSEKLFKDITELANKKRS